MKMINIGLIGFGTVGTGVVKLLKNNKSEILNKTNININLKKIADIDIKTDRGVNVKKEILTKNVYDIIKDPEIDIVIELIGGIGKAKEFILDSLKNGKHVVTANKALLSQYGKEIFAAAYRNKRNIGFEASVAGGIPIIKIIRESLVGNKIKKIMGIINGTTNFILTEMEEKNLDFSKALKLAQKAGIAEADPRLDISGEDAAHKIQILASYAFNTSIPFKSIYFEGINNIDLHDIIYVKELGYRIKLLAIAKTNKNREIECRIHPTIIPQNHLLASVKEEYNAILDEGDASGSQIFYGKGAGAMPTASAVVGDIVDIAKNVTGNKQDSIIKNLNLNSRTNLKNHKKITCRYYLRFHTIDRPGVLARITKILGDEGISISSVIQKETGRKIVPIIMLTHKANEENIQKALYKINQLNIVKYRAKMIRIENND